MQAKLLAWLAHTLACACVLLVVVVVGVVVVLVEVVEFRRA